MSERYSKTQSADATPGRRRTDWHCLALTDDEIAAAIAREPKTRRAPAFRPKFQSACRRSRLSPLPFTRTSHIALSRCLTCEFDLAVGTVSPSRKSQSESTSKSPDTGRTGTSPEQTGVEEDIQLASTVVFGPLTSCLGVRASRLRILPSCCEAIGCCSPRARAAESIRGAQALPFRAGRVHAVIVVPPPKKKAISIRVDPDVLNFFKNEGPGYQRRINAVLRSYVEQKQKRGKSA
jgi:uncharacterized protein (DUF4415 family)